MGGLGKVVEVWMYRLMTLPLAGAAGLEPCAVEGAVEVAIVLMYRYCSICIRLGVETNECRRVSSKK